MQYVREVGNALPYTQTLTPTLIKVYFHSDLFSGTISAILPSMKAKLVPILLCIVLVGCKPPAKELVVLPSAEVLERAAKATRMLESVQYLLQGQFDLESEAIAAKGTLRMDGMLQEAGKQLRFQLDVTADVTGVEDSSIDGTLEVVMLSDDEVYMNLHSLTAQPSSSVFHPELIGAIAGTWWLLPPEDNAPVTGGPITPDPRLLHMQSQVIQVDNDHGIVDLQGEMAYHYDVSIDSQKLLQYLEAVAKEQDDEFSPEEVQESLENISATGQIWINPETFFIEKLSWKIAALPLQFGSTVSSSFTMHFRKHNEAPPILPPQDAKVFNPAILLSLPEDALFPEELPEGAAGVEQGEFLDLLDQINALE